MKISKEGHKRAAVIVKTSSTGGVLYKVPGSETIDLQGELRARNRNVNVLYNIFNQVQTGKEPSEYKRIEGLSDKENKERKERKDTQRKNYFLRKACEAYVRRANSTINNIIFSRHPKEVLPNDKILINMGKERTLPPFSQKPYNFKLSDFVLVALRRSLVTDQFRGEPFDSRAAVVVFLKNIGNPDISAQDAQKIKTLMDLIREDYSKWDPKRADSNGAKAIRSIQNQNMVIQPKEGRLSLSEISNQDKKTETKSIEKSGLDTFLQEYAQLDESKRMESLRRLRRLIDTYFGAPASFVKGDAVVLPETVDTADFDVWQKHEEGKKAENIFASIPKQLLDAEQGGKKLETVDQKTSVEKLKADIRKRNMICYRFASAATEDEQYRSLFFENAAINQYWIHHIENAVERILKKCDVGTLFKLRVGYLSEKVWKDALNLLSIKYIALGKTVYHFALDDLWNDVADKKLGVINKNIAAGITSFDYELIKAQEDLQRELAVSTAFAANNLARAACNMRELEENKSDFLLWKRNADGDKNTVLLKDHRKQQTEDETLAAILQFFGGMSSWEKDYFKAAYPGQEDYAICFLDDLRRAIYAVRNESFHFRTASLDKGSWNTELFGNLFQKEAETCLTVEKDKFYSNNLVMFYRQSDLEKVLDKLYGKEVSRAAQIPSYNTILPRKSFPDFLVNEMGYKRPGYGSEDADKWYSACYYLFKESYYNLFLQSPNAKRLFGDAVKGLKGEDENQEKAVDDFKARYKEIAENASLAEICQTFMTEYNQQNNQCRKVRTADEGLFDKPIFQHYKLLLKKALVAAFAQYIKSEESLAFAADPVKPTIEVSREDFLPDWTSSKYKQLTDRVKAKPELQKWYIVGKFMNAKTLNLLVGSMRSYLQYVGDVQKRAKSIGSTTHVKAENVELVSEWIKVLEVCLLLAARTSVEFTDYYSDKEEFASYLGNYVDFHDNAMASEFSALLTFSGDIETDMAADLYVDAENPKVNRNIIQAKLYAPDTILANVVKKVSKQDIEKFYKQKKKIADCKVKGDGATSSEQQEILKYQKLKNRVELRDLAEYGELINELLGQLINWSFMRERDLLYFQLGFHYSCLMNQSEKPEAYKRLEGTDEKGKHTTIDNAILYQIVAMYVNGYPVYSLEKSGIYVGKLSKGSAGPKIGIFFKYSKNIGMGEEDVYSAGLEVFENVKEHGNITGLRNKIDHFKYYQGKDSLLSMYGEVFDRFFTYDMKYQKNVLNHLENLLLRHNVIIKPVITTGTKEVGTKQSIKTKKCAAFDVAEISSDQFTYKVKDDTLVTDAKNYDYLETVRDILFYPAKSEARIISKADRKDGGKAEKSDKGKNRKSKDGRENFVAYKQRESLGNFAFADAFKDIKL